VGRPNAAAAGELLSYLAGDKAAVEKVTPVCKAYSKTVKYVSEHHGAANSLKLCVNYTVASIIETFGEVYAFAEKSGVDLNILREFLENAMGHPALKMYTGKIMNRDFDGKGGFAMVGGFKDVTLMLNASNAVGVPRHRKNRSEENAGSHYCRHGAERLERHLRNHSPKRRPEIAVRWEGRDLIHSDDSQIAQSNSSSRQESRNCRVYSGRHQNHQQDTKPARPAPPGSCRPAEWAPWFPNWRWRISSAATVKRFGRRTPVISAASTAASWAPSRPAGRRRSPG
jgi:hypothetical protein